MTIAAARERAKARTKKENAKKSTEAKNRLVPMRDNGEVCQKRALGTPIGNKQRMVEFKEQLLKAENGKKVITKVLEVAMDDEHPNQAAALKMCMDRMLPTSLFEEEKKGDSFTISISTILGEALGRSLNRTFDHDSGHVENQTITITQNRTPAEEEDE
jgi:hypothetical protein